MSFESALQQALFQRLAAYPGMPTVYDSVPEDNAAFPYVVIGEDTHAPWDTDDSVGAESTITFHVWSRYRGTKEVKEIQGLIYAALNRHELSVSGFDLVTLEFEYSDVVLDADGYTRHGVCRYRSLVEQVS